MALAEPALFHSFMWGATLHISIKGRTLIRHPSLVRQHYNAVQLLNAEFSKGITGVRDTLLLSIVAFLTHEIEATDVFEATDEGFQPTFADLQLLDVYSRRPFVQIHWNALKRFVDLRGGPESLQMPGLGALIQHIDIISSSFTLWRPHFHAPLHLDAMGKCELRWRYFGHGIYMDDDRTPTLQHLIACGLENTLFDVIRDMRILTALMEAYNEKKVDNPNLSHLTMNRNLIHRRLLCTLPGEAEAQKATESELNITTLTRTVVMIFALGVTFPITYKQPSETLVNRLKRLITLHRNDLLNLDMSDFLTWALIIGGVASAGGTVSCLQQPWYVQQLVEIEALYQLRSLTSQDTGSCRSWTEIQHVCRRSYGSS